MRRYVGFGDAINGDTVSWAGDELFLHDIIVHMEGVAAEGVTVDLDDFGAFTLQHQGRQGMGMLLNLANPALLAELNDYLYGEHYIDAAAGGATDVMFRIPLGGLGLGENSLYSGRGERYSLEVPDLGAAVLASGQYRIAIEASHVGETVFAPRYQDTVVNAGGEIFELPRNTTHIVLGAAATTNPDNIAVYRDQELLFEGSYEEFLSDTQIRGSYTGTDAPTYPVIDITEGGVDRVAMAGPMHIKTDGGTGDMKIMYVSHTPQPDRLPVSKQATEIRQGTAAAELIRQSASSEVAASTVKLPQLGEAAGQTASQIERAGGSLESSSRIRQRNTRRSRLLPGFES